MNNTTVLCAISKVVSDRVELKILYILECIFGIVALFPNFTTLVLLWRVKVFHANLRLILANSTCNLLIFSTAAMAKAIQRLANEPCAFPMLFRSCMIIDWTVLIPLHNALLSVLILGLERLYATVRYRTYDYAGSVPFLGTFLIASSWITTLSLNVPSYFDIPAAAMVPICETAVVATKQRVAVVIITMVSLESVAAGLMTFVYISNKYILGRMGINRARYDLSSRFQIGQNVQLNRALMPGTVLHVVCYLPNYIFLTSIFAGGTQFSIDTKTWLLHLTYVWRLVYALVDPILLITLNSTLKKKLRESSFGRVFPCLRGRNERKMQDVATKSKEVMNAHFDYLRNAWAIKPFAMQKSMQGSASG